jgi:hypothetical protein
LLKIDKNFIGKVNNERMANLTDQIYGSSISPNLSRWENKNSQKTLVLKRKKKK